MICSQYDVLLSNRCQFDLCVIRFSSSFNVGKLSNPDEEWCF